MWVILEDLRTHREGLLAPGFWAILVYRFGHWALGLPRLIGLPLRCLHLILYKGVEILFGITLPAGVTVGRRLDIEHLGGIVLHGRSVIGNDCLLRQGVTLGNRHPDRLDDAPILGDRVNVGAGAKILGRVRVGDGAAIGANAVVLDDVPAGASAVGVPARVVHTRREARPKAPG